MLPPDLPPVLAPFYHVQPPRLVSAIAVVITRPKIPILVERQVLRISQARRKQFQLAPIRITAKHCTGVRIRNLASALVYVQTAVRDAEIELPVRAKLQPMQIVSAERNMNAETAGERSPGISDAIAVRILQQPKVWDAREVNIPF